MSGRRILIIQDFYPIALATQAALRRAGHVADFTDLGEEALERAAACDYDVIIVDDVLPDISGFEIIRTLRDRGFAGTILFTSTSYDFGPRALALGADRIVTIPVDYDALLESVAALRAPA